MKIGVYIPDHLPEEGGGYTIANDIYSSLLETGKGSSFTFVIFTANEFENKKADHIEYIKIPRNRLINFISQQLSFFLRRLPARIRYRTKIERIIETSGVDLMWYLSPMSCLTMEVPYMTIVLDLQHRLQPFFPEISAQGEWDRRERFYRSVLRRAAIIIAGTDSGRAEIQQFYNIPYERIRVLPHPTPRFSLSSPIADADYILDKFNIPGDYLFYPAQFWPHKNHAGLLMAVKILRDDHDLKIPLVLVGSDKGNRQYIKNLADNFNLTDQVYFLGFVSKADMVALYRKAFALTYLTYFGPENLPPLESFALGCPVIASNVAGAKEQLGDAALLVEPSNKEEIAYAIKKIFEDHELRQNLIEKGKRRAEKYTCEGFIRDVFSIFRDCEPVFRCWSNSSEF